MRASFFIPAALAAMAAANPVPQDLDFDAIAAIEPMPAVTIPVVDAAALATTVAYTSSVAASTVSAAIVASGLSTADTDDTDDASKKVKRQTIAVQTTQDTPEAFLANTTFSKAALAAPVPVGYTQSFQNLNASNNAYGYMGYSVFSAYNTTKCAAKCNAINGCRAFNLYFERDPSTTPTSANPNPSSVTIIKCVYWGGPVTTDNAVNNGQYQESFHVVIAGSNGYISNAIAPVPGYNEPTYLGTASINAPNDCNGNPTYMGVRIFNTGPFDAGLCAAACTATSQYDVEHGLPTVANPQTCQFYVTYILNNNTHPIGQYCAMYNQTWSSSYATNVGQYDQAGNHYTITSSYSYSNTTNPGTCVKSS